MAANNLRVLYSNVADFATITTDATAAGFPTSNMQTDIKGLVWRSTSQAATVITLSWGTNTTINSVILPYTNLSTSATVRVVCKNSTPTTIYDSGTIQAVPYTLPSAGTSNYSYGGGSVVRVYLPTVLTTVRTIEITIVDTGSLQGYMEVSRILCGNYWSPEYNLDYGVTVDYKDQSQHSRAQAGNIITDIAPIYKILSFNIGYMEAVDRNALITVLKQNGMRKSIWVSLFPSDTDKEKEYIYSIYGKLSQNATISHPMYSQYTSTLTIEEV